MFKTEPEDGLNGRSLNYPRGKVIGGSSSINAMIYMRGQAADYDHWRQLGLTGWGSDDVLPFFRRHEDHFLGESEAHAVGGELRIEAPRVRWDLLDAFCAAAEQAGIKRIADFNTGDNEGSCAFHVNQKRGRRWSAARAFDSTTRCSAAARSPWRPRNSACSRARTPRESAPTSSSTCSRSRSTNSAIRCTNSPRSPRACATCSRRAAGSCGCARPTRP